MKVPTTNKQFHAVLMDFCFQTAGIHRLKAKKLQIGVSSH